MNPMDPGGDELEQEQQDPIEKPAARMVYRQLTVSERELGRLSDRIYQDFLAARSDHDSRIERFRRYYRMWRGLPTTKGTRQEGNDLQIPMLKWTLFGGWAKFMSGLLGDDAEIIGKSAAPSSQSDAKKAGLYMSWRFFEYMEAVRALAPFTFRALLFGRSFAEIIYEQEYFWQRDSNTGEDTEQLCYDGPRMRALWASQIIVPAQDNVDTVDDFEWVIRRDRITPQQLLDGERRGKFQGITENWDKIAGAASQRQERDYWWDDEKIDADEAEGVDHVNMLGNRDSLEIWRWYGTWRLPTSARDTRPENIKYREIQPSELLVSYLPRVGIIVGIQDRRDLYPRLKKRLPIVDLATVKEGSYWAPGFGEMCEDLQNESSINHALFRKAGMFSVGPIIFFKPSGGWDPDTFEYTAGMAVPTENPESVKVVTLNANLEYSQQMQEVLKAINELVTGVSDQTLGRASDRPNAPQTASGQAMLLNEGNTRASLDMTMLRSDLDRAVQYVWELDSEYADEKVFFRVTDADAVGFDTSQGFGTMTAEERMHPYTFGLKFATSVWSREAKKQHMLQIYGLSIQNPIVMQNPRALWVLLNRIWQAFGEDDFRDVVPEPPEPDASKRPQDEWTLMLKGEIVHVTPLDDDGQHLLDHRKRLEQEINEPPERQDKELIALAGQHIIDHERQIRQKQVLQHLVQQALQAVQPQPQPMGGPQGGPAPQATNGIPQPPSIPSVPPPGGAPPPGALGPVTPANQNVIPQ